MVGLKWEGLSRTFKKAIQQGPSEGRSEALLEKLKTGMAKRMTW